MLEKMWFIISWKVDSALVNRNGITCVKYICLSIGRNSVA